MDAQKTVGIQSAALAAATELMSQATAAAVGWEKEVEAVKKSAETDIKAITDTLDAGDRAHQLMIGKLNAAHSDARKKLMTKIDDRNKQLQATLVALEARKANITLQTVVDSKPVQATVKVADKGLGHLGKLFGHIHNRIAEGMAQSK
jgi:hypothetical protein